MYITIRVREVGINGIITTAAGDGGEVFSGDGGAATNAELDMPEGVAVDASGNLFIADYYNNRIRISGATRAKYPTVKQLVCSRSVASYPFRFTPSGTSILRSGIPR